VTFFIIAGREVYPPEWNVGGSPAGGADKPSETHVLLGFLLFGLFHLIISNTRTATAFWLKQAKCLQIVSKLLCARCHNHSNYGNIKTDFRHT